MKDDQNLLSGKINKHPKIIRIGYKKRQRAGKCQSNIRKRKNEE
jgi:hypothetical protein